MFTDHGRGRTSFLTSKMIIYFILSCLVLFCFVLFCFVLFYLICIIKWHWYAFLRFLCLTSTSTYTAASANHSTSIAAFSSVSAFPFLFGSSYSPPLPMFLLCFTWHIKYKRKIEVAMIWNSMSQVDRLNQGYHMVNAPQTDIVKWLCSVLGTMA